MVSNPVHPAFKVKFLLNYDKHAMLAKIIYNKIQMRNYVWLAVLFFIGMSCKEKQEILYQSDAYTVYTDKVTQGDNEAKAISATEIVSNYQSRVYEIYSRLVTFKFSINEKDNEKPSGADHWIIIGDEHESPIIKFGQDNEGGPADPGTKLPANYEYTFRVDMNPVFAQFKKQGFYETFDGTRIAKEDFKSICIAGGAAPLSWDFSNLEENGLGLKDPDGDGIYELTVVLNPYDQKNAEVKTWKLSTNLSSKPVYHSDQKIVDALFNLSLEEALMNIEPDSTLRTGAKWGGVWTRDVSYSILLAFAYHEPEVAKISLMRKVNRDRIVQDTGSGGAWPVSSDRTTWSLAAWELYKVTGDKAWLKTAYTVIKNTLDDDYKNLRSPQTGMYRGESSFLDWREQTYPKWMSNMDIYVSENLGTNAVHYRAHKILAEMAKLLGEPYKVYEERAEEIKEGINKYLWMNEKGFYGQYLYGRSSLLLSPRFEALGEALAVLFDVADDKRAASVLENSPLTPFGATCIYPQIPGIPPYHNNGIWPFVQSYWNLAAAKVGNEKVLNHGLAAIYRAGGLFLTNYENFVAENGDYVGTEINSHRMLWSMAGNLAIVHRVFMGISFETDGIRFQPVIPKAYSGTKTLKNFKYRKAILDLKVTGYGNQIASISLDGKPLEDAFIPASITGKHQVEIIMANNDFSTGKINRVENKFSLSNPQTKLSGSTIRWKEIPGAVSYNVYQNGAFVQSVKQNQFEINNEKFGEYSVTALDAEGMESFSGEPILVCIDSAKMLLEVENFARKSSLTYTNFSGKGFVEITPRKNQEITVSATVQQAGTWLLDIHYANGTGPWNTDNNCTIRSLYVNKDYIGALVFPQRGTDEWSDWGFSNACEVQLKKGKNEIRIVFEAWNVNMDGEINDALLDYIRLIKKG